MMDPRSKELLDNILAKDPEKLDQDDIDVLRARQSYLKASQLKEYREVLEPKEEKPPLYIAKKYQTSQEEPVKENDQETK